MDADDGLVALESQALQVLAQVTVRQEAVARHLAVEELLQALLCRLDADVADVQAARLARLRADGRAGADGAEDGRAVEQGGVVRHFGTGGEVRLGLAGEVEHA